MALQAQLVRAEAAAQTVVDHANLAATVPNMTLPLMQQVWPSLSPADKTCSLSAILACMQHLSVLWQGCKGGLAIQGNIGTAVSILLPGSAAVRIAQGSLSQPVVASAGYSIFQLLQSIGLEV